NGAVTGKAVGSGTVYATQGSVEGNAPVTVSQCPTTAGWSVTGGRCSFTYDIPVGQLVNQGTFCDGTGDNRYNGCNQTPWGISWTDASPGLSAVTAVSVN